MSPIESLPGKHAAFVATETAESPPDAGAMGLI
jgi:hypothetical protein